MASLDVRDIIVIGGSAGALEAVSTIVRGLPSSLCAAVAIVVHHHPQAPDLFGSILNRLRTLPATTVDGEARLEHGRIYVPRSDRHLVLMSDKLVASRGARENRVRPAVDPLFRSAAEVHGRRVMGIVLTGNLDDGSAGLRAIKRAGGLTVVQDPEDAEFPGMPTSALALVDVHHRVPVAQIPALIVRAVEGRLETSDGASAIVAGGQEPPARLVEIACPTCHGTLSQIDDGKVVTFRCHTGHRFGPDSLAAGLDEDLEIAVWSAIRALQEKIIVLDQARGRGRAHPAGNTADRHRDERERLEHHVSTLRRLLDEG